MSRSRDDPLPDLHVPKTMLCSMCSLRPHSISGCFAKLMCGLELGSSDFVSAPMQESSLVVYISGFWRLGIKLRTSLSCHGRWRLVSGVVFWRGVVAQMGSAANTIPTGPPFCNIVYAFRSQGRQTMECFRTSCASNTWIVACARADT